MHSSVLESNCWVQAQGPEKKKKSLQIKQERSAHKMGRDPKSPREGSAHFGEEWCELWEGLHRISDFPQNLPICIPVFTPSCRQIHFLIALLRIYTASVPVHPFSVDPNELKTSSKSNDQFVPQDLKKKKKSLSWSILWHSVLAPALVYSFLKEFIQESLSTFSRPEDTRNNPRGTVQELRPGSVLPWTIALIFTGSSTLRHFSWHSAGI